MGLWLTQGNQDVSSKGYPGSVAVCFTSLPLNLFFRTDPKSWVALMLKNQINTSLRSKVILFLITACFVLISSPQVRWSYRATRRASTSGRPSRLTWSNLTLTRQELWFSCVHCGQNRRWWSGEPVARPSPSLSDSWAATYLTWTNPTGSWRRLRPFKRLFEVNFLSVPLRPGQCSTFICLVCKEEFHSIPACGRELLNS